MICRPPGQRPMARSQQDCGCQDRRSQPFPQSFVLKSLHLVQHQRRSFRKTLVASMRDHSSRSHEQQCKALSLVVHDLQPLFRHPDGLFDNSTHRHRACSSCNVLSICLGDLVMYRRNCVPARCTAPTVDGLLHSVP